MASVRPALLSIAAVRWFACACLVIATVFAYGHPARANDCPPVTTAQDAVDADCVNSEVPTVDPDGQPIPYVQEITAPPDGTALTFDDD